MVYTYLHKKNSDILSHNYFSISANDLDSHYNSLMADKMVENFINTANNIGKDIKAFIPINLKGSAFYCPYYIKKLSHEKHIAFRNIKPYFNCENVIITLNNLINMKNFAN